ncbi:hypothetical protein SLA2020_233020 [Shorea laevis]
MVGMKLLFQARRLAPPKYSSPFRSFSSSSPQPDTTSNPSQSSSESPLGSRQLVPIQPISYAPKPEVESEQQERPPSNQIPRKPVENRRQAVTQDSPSSWTPEGLRYVKNVPSVMPVSYPTRVAPLPEDRAPQLEEGRNEMDEARTVESEEMGRERQRVEMENRGMMRALRIAVEEEKAVVPFPTLIKPEKKSEKRPVLDLMDAIRQVKANAKAWSELIVRGTMAVPHGISFFRESVAVFAEGADADEARDAGADIVGGAELIEEIAIAGKIDFDRSFSTPKIMPKLFKISRILNQHGLMPNPKIIFLFCDVTRAIKEAKEGQVKFRMDKTSIVHVGLGKVSFSEESLCDNMGAFMNALLLAKPASLKKTSKYAGYVNSFHICSTVSLLSRFYVSLIELLIDFYASLIL